MSQRACLHLVPSDDTDLVGYYQLYRCLNFTNITRQQEAFQAHIEASQRRELPVMLGLTAAFGVLIAAGLLGNALLISSVCCSRRAAFMRNSHAAFVLNLACSDLLLCLVTQPLNVLRLLQGYYGWRYGAALCKLGNMLTGVNLFVSTFSISAIALDRFHTIAHPSTSRLPRRRLRAFVLLIWCLGFLMSAPLAWLARVMENRLMLTERSHLCSEHTAHPAGNAVKLAYSCASLAVQFLIPLLVLLCAYARISRVVQRRTNLSLRRRPSRREVRRQARAKTLLAMTVGLFAVSWCPLTTLNVYMDVKTWRVHGSTEPAASEPDDAFRIQLVQGCCLLLVLLSACANPALHGFFNESLRSEVRRMVSRRSKRLAQKQLDVQQQQGQQQPQQPQQQQQQQPAEEMAQLHN